MFPSSVQRQNAHSQSRLLNEETLVVLGVALQRPRTLAAIVSSEILSGPSHQSRHANSIRPTEFRKPRSAPSRVPVRRSEIGASWFWGLALAWTEWHTPYNTLFMPRPRIRVMQINRQEGVALKTTGSKK